MEIIQYIQEAKRLPECRTELVEHFGHEVQVGAYPPPSTLDRFSRLLVFGSEDAGNGPVS